MSTGLSIEHCEEGTELQSMQTEHESVPAEPTRFAKKLLFTLRTCFFLFGLINNVLYVIILSAALDLVPPSTPKGIIAFCNIAPALVAKVGWPYILKGRIRYAKRLIGCCLISSLGMILVAAFDSLSMRLLGISLASFSSGLGELTFLQLSTTYHPQSIGGHCIGYFASGTGAAGLFGAFAWWELRALGVRLGVGISSVLPFLILVGYYILPRPSVFASISIPPNAIHSNNTISEYAPLATDEDGTDASEINDLSEPDREAHPKRYFPVALTMEDKLRLVKPLILKYMLPLFCVYIFEYTINQGIAPTLVYPVPTSNQYPILAWIIHSIRDYYPLWQLVYQCSVFFSRSSISLGIPPLPPKLLSLPAYVQFVILTALALESAIGIVPDDSEGLAITLVFILISLEGICGGLAYVNVFYRINQEKTPETTDEIVAEQAKQEREFKIGSIGFADSSGILLASILAVPTEIGLCKAQRNRGKTYCADL